MIDPSVNTHCDQNNRAPSGGNPAPLHYDPVCPNCGFITGREGLPGRRQWADPHFNDMFDIVCRGCGEKLNIVIHIFAKYSATRAK